MNGSRRKTIRNALILLNIGVWVAFYIVSMAFAVPGIYISEPGPLGDAGILIWKCLFLVYGITGFIYISEWLVRRFK